MILDSTTRMLSPERASMRRTQIVAALAALFGLLTTIVFALAGTGPVGAAASVVSAAGALASAVLACAMAAILKRQRDIELGREDWFERLNADRSEAALRQGKAPRWSALRRSIARLAFGHRLLVGEVVVIRPLDEIRATLDVNGALDELPFMQEMASLCGRAARVYRVVDKIYDYGKSRQMRRLDNCVLLEGLRCDGGDHGDCEAACYLIWKQAWLTPVVGPKPAGVSPAPPTTLPLLGRPAPHVELPDRQFRCQYTSLARASRPIGRFDLSRAVGAYVVGNVSLRAFLVVALTRLANAVQALRGGVTYPARPNLPREPLTSVATLSAGQWVRVRTPAQIAATLDRNSKNRGLWFDRDMLKHARQTRRVLGRVERIIDITTERMIAMKTPCIVLEDVHYSGEFQWFGEQHDFTYWREAWLEPVSTESASRVADG